MLTRPTFETPRLLLRQWNAGDAGRYGELLADPGAARFIVPGGQPVTDPLVAWHHTAVMAGHWALQGVGMFVVEDKATHCFLGRVGLWNPPGWFGNELAWAIVKSARGKGIAFEASRAAMHWAFAQLATNELIHCIDEENAPSQLLARSLGAQAGEAITLFGRPARIWSSSRQRFATRHG